MSRDMQYSPLPPEPGMPGTSLLGFMAGASVVRRHAFLEAGGFPLASGIGGEEQWLAADLAGRGWWLCYVPSLCVHHCPSTLRNSASRRRCLIRNALCFAWLRRPLPSALRVTAALTRSEPWDRHTVLGFAAGAAGVLRGAFHRRVVAAEVERNFQILEGRLAAVAGQGTSAASVAAPEDGHAL